MKRTRFVLILQILSLTLSSTTVLADCSGPPEIKKETKFCIYDISYPVLADKEAECEIRQLIDKFVSDSSDVPDFESEKENKSEINVSYIVTDWAGIENILIDCFQYTGGAHGAETLLSYNYDIKTGKRYKLFDVLDAHKSWFKTILPYVNNTTVTGFGNIQMDDSDSTSDEFATFVLDKGDLILYFDPCIALPCAYGIVKVHIPLSEIKDVLKDSFSFKK